MSPKEILFDANGHAISPSEISNKINNFRDSYNNAVGEIIKNSKDLDQYGDIFIKCASRILKSFGMTRRGPFRNNLNEILHDCWNAIGADLIEIKKYVLKHGLSRDRYLLEIDIQERDELIRKIWLLAKMLLPFTMAKNTYGLVGASKILFSVLPELVLPVDNDEWKIIFKTVDLGDVINHMIFDIQNWEAITGFHFNELDHSNRLTTLPSVYNVMAMQARP